MVIDQAAELPIDGARAMLNHLRQFPTDATRPPDELAEQFNLPLAFVQNILTNANRPVNREEPVLTRPIHFDWPARTYTRIKATFARLSLQPVSLILATNIVTLLLVLYFGRVVPSTAKIGDVRVDLVGICSAFFLAMVIHSVCFYRNRRILLPLQTSFINWAFITGALSVGVLLSPNTPPQGAAMTIVYLMIGIFMLCAGLAAVGAIIALLGSWGYERAMEKRELQFSRQDLLERYFELQSRLERGTRGQRVYHWLEQTTFSRWFRRWPVPVVVTFWLLIQVTSMVVSTITGAGDSRGPSGTTGAFSPLGVAGTIFLVGLLAVELIGLSLFGFLSRSIPRALGYGVISMVVTFGASLIPIGRYGVEHALRPENLIATFFFSALLVIFSGFAGLAGELNFRASLRGNVDRNDPASIMAEMLRIQWRLSEDKQNVCVLVVDAAKSSRMKAEADALDAEYSFRLYQEWIAEQCAGLGGKVHSTAGDGAVVSFSTCESAFAAARRMQTDVHRFNREDNILSLPFQLRIGLHHGAVTAQIDEVEFTEVIDIAAHVEGRAMVGGIAVTNDVVACLDASLFIPLAEEVDGKQLFLARNPTED